MLLGDVIGWQLHSDHDGRSLGRQRDALTQKESEQRRREGVSRVRRCAADVLRYLPQPPRALLLVDVDEVPHHAALDQTPLSLHSDLEGQTQTNDGQGRDNDAKPLLRDLWQRCQEKNSGSELVNEAETPNVMTTFDPESDHLGPDESNSQI